MVKGENTWAYHISFLTRPAPRSAARSVHCCSDCCADSRGSRSGSQYCRFATVPARSAPMCDVVHAVDLVGGCLAAAAAEVHFLGACSSSCCPRSPPPVRQQFQSASCPCRRRGHHHHHHPVPYCQTHQYCFFYCAKLVRPFPSRNTDCSCCPKLARPLLPCRRFRTSYYSSPCSVSDGQHPRPPQPHPRKNPKTMGRRRATASESFETV